MLDQELLFYHSEKKKGKERKKQQQNKRGGRVGYWIVLKKKKKKIQWRSLTKDGEGPGRWWASGPRRRAPTVTGAAILVVPRGRSS